MSEVYRYVISTSIMITILLVLMSVTFTILIYTDLMACRKICELIECRIIEVIAYGQFEGNITVNLSFNDIVSRGFELYVINSSCIEVRVPLRYLSNVVVRKCVILPERVILNYTGLIPPSFTLIFREINGKVVINVRT